MMVLLMTLTLVLVFIAGMMVGGSLGFVFFALIAMAKDN